MDTTLDPALVEAILKNDISTFKLLVKDESFEEASMIYLLEFLCNCKDKIEFIIQLLQIRVTVVDSLLKFAVYSGKAELVEILLQYSLVDPCVSCNYPLRVAASKGDHQIVRLLLKHPKIKTNEPEILVSSIEILKVLAEDERIVWGARNNIALRVACQNAHPQSVELILKQRGVDASPDDDYCLRISVEKGSTEIVQLLLKRPEVDPTSLSNKALWNAIRYQFKQIIILLFSHLKLNPSYSQNLFLLQIVNSFLFPLGVDIGKRIVMLILEIEFWKIKSDPIYALREREYDHFLHAEGQIS